MENIKGKKAKTVSIFSNPALRGSGEDSPEASQSSSSTRGLEDKKNLYAEGIIAGVIGATVIAAWFFILDLIQGRPFHTPTVLGTALFSARNPLSPEEHLHPFSAVVMYTWVHLLVFAVIGVIASWLLNWVEKNPSLGFGTLLFFVFFVFFFVVSSFIFASPILGALAWPTVLLGNLLAAGGMATYLWYRHPNLIIRP
jgi:hypothetical protein